MAEFTDDIWAGLVREEGSQYTNRPNDKGGPTKYGITLATLKRLKLDIDANGIIDAEDVKKITDPKARQIALAEYWQKFRCHEITDALVAARYFSIAYNSPLLAGLSLQRACRACGVPVAEDGAVGSQTIAAVNQIYAPTLLAAFRSECAGFYRLLAALDKTQEANLPGWLNRAYR